MRDRTFCGFLSDTLRARFDRRSTWTRFCDSTSGNTAIIFALAFIPIMGLIGTAVDYGHAAAIRTAMQSTADATALAIARQMAGTKIETNVDDKATAFFKSVFTRSDTKDIYVTGTFTPSPAKVVITARANMSTSIMGIVPWGFDKIPLVANSTTSWGNTRLRVALVLDNTGSMTQGGSKKLETLKNATKDLLTQLSAAATTSDDVYVSIIPFAKDVAVDKTKYSENWIYWGTAAQDPTLADNKSWDALNGTCSAGNYSSRSKCFQQWSCSIPGYNSQNSCTSAGVCSNPRQTNQSDCTGERACSKDYGSRDRCEDHNGVWGYGTWTPTPGTWSRATWTPDNHNTWNGCLMDRGDVAGPKINNAGNYDTNTLPADAVSNGVASLFPAEQFSPCPKQVTPLTNNWTTLNDAVTAMTSGGNTNQAIGLVHGWQSLVGGGPYPAPPAEDSKYVYQKVIILLTDGLNTDNRWDYPVADIDAREKLTCDNINAAKITLYTIQVNTNATKDPTSTVLQNCAGNGDPKKYPDASKFYEVTTTDGIVTVFREIGEQISRLHVAY